MLIDPQGGCDGFLDCGGGSWIHSQTAAHVHSHIQFSFPIATYKTTFESKFMAEAQDTPTSHIWIQMRAELSGLHSSPTTASSYNLCIHYPQYSILDHRIQAHKRKLLVCYF